MVAFRQKKIDNLLTFHRVFDLLVEDLSSTHAGCTAGGGYCTSIHDDA